MAQPRNLLLQALSNLAFKEGNGNKSEMSTYLQLFTCACVCASVCMRERDHNYGRPFAY